MESSDISSVQYSPLFEHEESPQSPANESASSYRQDEQMDVDEIQSSAAYSDMIWSPIPTQSTLNNWYMLTRSLSADLNGEPKDAPVSDISWIDSVEMNAVGAVIGNGSPAPAQSSPDMFAESPASIVDTDTLSMPIVVDANKPANKDDTVFADDLDVDMGQQSYQPIMQNIPSALQQK